MLWSDLKVAVRGLIAAPGLSAVGVGAGTVLAYLSGRWLQSLLVGVSPADGMTFAVAAALAAATAIAGSLRPALRAARVDPVTAIRLE